MNTPRISIIINNYNYENYVGKAISSALEQEYTNVEVVVVDDGSTDRSAAVIKQFNVDKFEVKQNGGQVSALNRGFSLSSGDVVIFLDADDYLYPSCCKAIADVYQRETCCYQFKLDVIDGNGQPTGGIMPVVDLLDTGHQSFVKQHGYIPAAPMSGMAYSKEYAATVLPADERVWQSAYDGYLVYVAAATGLVTPINQSHGAYRVHGKSESQHDHLSMRKQRQMMESQVLYAEGIYDRLVSYNVNLSECTIDNLLGAYHWKSRLDSFFQDNAHHNFIFDTKYLLIKNMIRAFLNDSKISLPKKSKNIVLALAYVVLPPILCIKLSKLITVYSDIK
jgi:glycosyltransferase involved in cell wall biosynthesis